MAFINNLGRAISFDCSELIEELKADIAEFGGDRLVEVVTEKKHGVTIYKDYNFIDDGKGESFCLSDSEMLQRMTASALLSLYEKENEVF